MAFELEILTKTGYPAKYWNIKELYTNYQARVARFVLVLYKDKEAYKAGASPLEEIPMNWIQDQFIFDKPEYKGMAERAVIYKRIVGGKIKTDATSVLLDLTEAKSDE